MEDQFSESLLAEVREGSQAFGMLAKDENAFARALEAFLKRDVRGLRIVLEQLGLLQRCFLICRWLCVWYCIRICRIVCRTLPDQELSLPDLRELALGVARLSGNEAILKRLLEEIDREDPHAFHAVLNEFGLGRFCYYICFWICFVRCRLFCDLVCRPQPLPRAMEPLGELKEIGEALGQLARDENVFARAVEAVHTADANAFRAILEPAGLLQRCHLLCDWFCMLRCIRLCRVFCDRVLDIDLTIPELREFALGMARLGTNEGLVKRLGDAVNREDAPAFHTVLDEAKLGRFCYIICHWVCFVRCHLFCRILCPPLDYPLPVFRYIGTYNYLTQIDSASGGSGLTKSDSRAFFGNMRLHGVLPKKLYGQPMEYRFEIRALPAGAWVPVPLSQVAPTKIGVWSHDSGDPTNPETKDYVINGVPAADTLVPTVVGDWIQVPQESNFYGPEGFFSPNGDLIILQSADIVAWPVIDVGSIVAGQSTASAGLGTDQYFAIRMRVREVGNPASESTAGICERVAIYNRRYDNVAKGGTWAPQSLDDQLSAAMLNIVEIGGGCTGITNALTVRYTAAHPNLGAVSVSMNGPGGPYSFTLVDDGGATSQNRFGQATPSFVVANLSKCAYLVTLSVNLLLTTGDDIPAPILDHVAFCKE